MPNPTRCWLRPVSSAARVGEQTRRDVEAVVAQPVLREPRVVRGLDRTAEGARIAEPGVVDQDEQHVRRTLGRLDMARLVPVGHRVRERPLRRARERRPPDREPAAVDSCVRHRSTSSRLSTHGRLRRVFVSKTDARAATGTKHRPVGMSWHLSRFGASATAGAVHPHWAMSRVAAVRTKAMV